MTLHYDNYGEKKEETRTKRSVSEFAQRKCIPEINESVTWSFRFEQSSKRREAKVKTDLHAIKMKQN